MNSNQINGLLGTIVNFVQYVLQLLMSNPVALLAAMFLLLIGKKGSVKVGGSGVSVGK